MFNCLKLPKREKLEKKIEIKLNKIYLLQKQIEKIKKIIEN
jgi:FtsZ-binding cell division protein ZapB